MNTFSEAAVRKMSFKTVVFRLEAATRDNLLIDFLLKMLG